MTALILLLAVASFWCSIIIVIDMFGDEVWKGLVGLACGLYLVYYALVEFDHERKWPIVLTAILGGALTTVLIRI